MTGCRVLVTRHLFPAALDLLRPHVEVTYHDSRDGLTREEMIAAVGDHDALLCQLTDHIDAAVLAAADRLGIIANVAVGYDNIDMAAARARGVLVTNTPGVLTESTADLAFALLMATARQLTAAERFLRAGRWRQWEIDLFAGQEVHGRTLGILGMGRIGKAVVQRAKGFGMRVLYHSRTRLAPAAEAQLGVEWRSAAGLFAQSDFVSLHLPLDAATRHLVGAEALDRMPAHAILINTARGPIVDEAALLAALEARAIGGAGLDVYAAEPDIDRRFLDLDNVVLLPHIASATVATRTRMCCMAAENVLAFAAGQRPPNMVH